VRGVKGLIVLAVVVGAGFWFKGKYMTPPSEANQAYRDFAMLINELKWDEAKTRATSGAYPYIDGKQSEYYQLAQLIGPDHAKKDYIDTSAITYELESEETAGATTSITLFQTVEMREPNSPTHVRYHKERQTVKVEKGAQGYKISYVLAQKL
jgi:hypothetical protein